MTTGRINQVGKVISSDIRSRRFTVLSTDSSTRAGRRLGDHACGRRLLLRLAGLCSCVSCSLSARITVWGNQRFGVHYESRESRDWLAAAAYAAMMLLPLVPWVEPLATNNGCVCV